MSIDYATPVTELVPESLLPEGLADFLRRESGDLLDGIYYTDFLVAPRPDGISVLIDLVFDGELAFELPGLEGTALVLGGGVDGATALTVSVDVDADGFELRLDNITVALRFPPSILKPVAPSEGAPVPAHAQIQTHGSIVLDRHFNLSIEGFDSLDLPPAMVADSGVVIAASNVRLDLSRTSTLPEVAAAGFGDDFIGIYLGSASVRLPEGLPELVPADLVLTNAAIGTGGVSGKLQADYAPVYDETTGEFTGPGSGSLFGIPFGLKSVSIELHQNAFKDSALSGVMVLPFFDSPVEVDIALGLDGSFSVGLSSQDGLVTLSKPGILEIELDSIGFAVEHGVFVASVGGKLTPLFGGLDWPGFEVTKLSIDSQGHVHLDGGWLDLGSQYALDFHAFTLEITKIGFGTDPDGARWVGFSGALNLVEGLPAGASVDGLRVSWLDGQSPRVTLNGVSVHFEVPGVVNFEGTVSYREFTDEATGELVHRFDGEILLAITAIGLEIDANLVIGTAGTTPADTYTFFAIYIGVELPAGIPLGNTGLGLFGFAGLFALNMEPNRQPQEPWYGVGPTDGWYHRGAPAIPPGVTNLRTKWGQRRNSLALGAGVTLGTVSDNGYTFSGKVLLVLVIPGPIIMIEGKANLLKERAKLNAEPLFRKLAVLDFRAGSVLIGLDVKFDYGDEGELVGIEGGTEAYFSFNDPMAWHIYVGEKDPAARRIRARLFQLFDANMYLMVDAHQIASGAWIGFDKHWDFGPLAVRLEAWLQADTLLSFKPPHFNAAVWLHADIGLAVFGFGASLQADAKLTADVFKPTHILGDLSVKIDLPWPLPDFSAHLPLEWGPEKSPPPLPVPVKEVAVEHLKVTTSWPLPRGTLLAPDYDTDGDGFLDQPVPSSQAQAALPPPANAPVIPLDGRPHITFTRPVNDDGAIGALNAQPVVPEWEVVGDPSSPTVGTAQARYGLREVRLERWNGTAWIPAARKASDANPAGVATLYGTWAPVPPAPGATGDAGNQTKLWLWSKTPFDYTRSTSSSWADWLTAHYPDYPCIGPAPDRVVCCDFSGIHGAVTGSPWQATTVAGDMVVSWDAPARVTVDGALVVPPTVPPGATPNRIVVELSAQASTVDLAVYAAPIDDPPVCADFTGRPDGPGPNPRQEGAAVLLVLDLNGTPVLQSTIRSGGLDCGNGVRASVPRSAEVQLTLSSRAQPAEVRALAAGQVVASAKMAPGAQQQTLVLTADGITEIEVLVSNAETLLHKLCYRVGGVAAVSAVAQLADGSTVAANAVGGAIALAGPDILAVTLTGSGAPWGLVRACANVGPEPGDRTRREELRESVLTAIDTWPYTVGNVLLPHTAYRLAVATTVQRRQFQWDSSWNTPLDQTVYGYFRTEGPPGLAELSVPQTDPVPAEFSSGLADLTPYVRRTMPAPGARPVFRGYDVGVEFDEDYVDLMYRLAGADLAVYLYDANNRPVRDAAGRLLAMPNPWGVTESAVLDLAEQTWVTVVNESACASITTAGLPGDTTMTAAAPGQVLDADALYEARLVPLLLHETFQDAGLGRWTRSGTWTVGADSTVAGDGSMLTGDASWTGYRLAVYARSSAGGAIGVLFRYTDADNWYRFSMHRGQGYRRLERCVAGRLRVLAEDRFTYRAASDYLIAVEAIGPDLVAYLDGAEVFRLADAALPAGRIGLYCTGSARFTDVRVDDLRADAPVAYRFPFTTSRHTDFAHLVASCDDRTWVSTVGGAVPAGADPAGAPDDAEHRAYAALAGSAIGTAAAQVPQRLEVTRLDTPAGPAGLLVRSPEPIDWARTSVALSRAGAVTLAATPPGTLKITGYQPGNHLEVTAREATDLTGSRVEVRQPAGALPPSADNPVLADFGGPARGQVYEETFGAGALDRYTVVDQGTDHGPSAWTADATAIRQTSGVFGGSTAPADADKPGTVALLASGSWSAVRIAVTLGTASAGASGVVFRYAGEDAYYRLSTDHANGIRRLVKKFDGTVSTLWQDTSGASLSAPATLTVEAVGDHLVGLIDGVLAFSVRDPDVAAGRVGLYAWANPQATYTAFTVETLERDPARWEPAFGSLAEFTITDAAPSNWSATGGTLTQDETITDSAALGLDEYADLRLSATASGSGALLWRYADPDNHYRLTLAAPRQLTRHIGGTATILWEDTAPVTNASANVTVTAIGGRITASADGTPLFDVTDSALLAGRVGFHATGAAAFSRVLLADPARQVGAFTIVDLTPPSTWRTAAGALIQSGAGETLAIDTTPVADARLRFRLRTAEAKPIGVAFRYADAANHYRLVLDAGQPAQSLVRVTGGTATTLWSRTAPSPVDAPYDLTIDLAGDRIAGYLDGELLFDVHDADHASGGIGGYTAGNPAAQFLSVERTDVPLEARALLQDRFAVTGTTGWVTTGTWQVADAALTAVGAAASAVAGDPQWTDILATARVSGQAGILFRYTDADNWYRFTADSLTTCVAGVQTTLWQANTPATDPVVELVVAATGQRIRGFIGGVLAVSATDAGHMRGQAGISAAPGASAAAVRVFDPAAVAPPSLLHDDLAVHRPIWTIDGPLGTAGDTGWTDYRLTASFHADGSAMTVLARCTDAQHAYRFEADPAVPYRRLTRVTGGTTTVLWEDTEPLTANRDYVLTLDCVADRITGYLDGAPMFEVYDNALPAGAIGLSPLAAFTEVRVTSAEWVAYHRFPAQDRVPAGTRVRVPALDLPDGALVRTVGESGAPSGGRRVFGDNRYQAEQFRILRAVDGTGFALLATPFPHAERRLRLTYRRDNTAIDPDSPVLRSAGDASPETATLDIPWPAG